MFVQGHTLRRHSAGLQTVSNQAAFVIAFHSVIERHMPFVCVYFFFATNSLSLSFHLSYINVQYINKRCLPVPGDQRYS